MKHIQAKVTRASHWVSRSGVRAERRLLGLKGRGLVLGQRLLPIALQVLQAQEGVHAVPRHAHQLQVAAWPGHNGLAGKTQPMHEPTINAI